MISLIPFLRAGSLGLAWFCLIIGSILEDKLLIAIATILVCAILFNTFSCHGVHNSDANNQGKIL
ncbi:hypothetical protein KLEP7_gp72 [Pseudaeromonas phage vB_PpeM_ KLEP7]|nr:hypothetical protein KLEP7_gp72 [Pseudaeromonas phage vB_PpeM_ KLEP7]